MSTVQSINPITTQKPILNAKNTGFAALGGMCLTVASAKTKAKPLRKQHKCIGYITGALTLLHVAIIALHHSSRKNSSSK